MAIIVRNNDPEKDSELKREIENGSPSTVFHDGSSPNKARQWNTSAGKS